MSGELRIVHYLDVKKEPVMDQSSRGAWIRWLISWEHGAPNFAMRMFEVEPNGNTPMHSHNWEHEIFIVEGEGLIVCSGRKHRIKEGYAILIPPNVEHSIVNDGDKTLKLLCLIPKVR
ncbi:MAG: cupin domain-containing protein [Candidatus Bathyarchaeia archaeon]